MTAFSVSELRLSFAWSHSPHTNLILAIMPSLQQPLCTEILNELRFAVSCCGKSTKPASPKKRQDAPDYYMEGNGTTLMPLNTGYPASAKQPIGFKDEYLH